MPDHAPLQPVAVRAADGHAFTVLARLPVAPRAALLWLPALGVAARHYEPFAHALAQYGIAVFLHEWRGHGSSGLRAGRRCNWGYRELLTLDLPASDAAITTMMPSGTPRIIGGHSLGGQLAACRLALAPASAGDLWLVGSGAPYWRAFPPPTRYGLPIAYATLRTLADLCGALPGRHIGFGGREARGVIDDWAGSALGGRYGARGLDVDLEQALRRVRARITALHLARDWYAPEPSLRFLLSKLPEATATVARIDDETLGARSDHFRWMRSPAAVAARLACSPAAPAA